MTVGIKLCAMTDSARAAANGRLASEGALLTVVAGATAGGGSSVVLHCDCGCGLWCFW